MASLHELRALIGAVRRRWLALTALRTVGIAALLSAVPLAAAAVSAWSLAPEGAALIAVAGIAAAGAVVAACAVFWRMPRPPSDLTTARFIEEQTANRRLGSLDDTLDLAAKHYRVHHAESLEYAQVLLCQVAVESA